MKAVALIALVLAAALPHGKGNQDAGCRRFDVKGTLQRVSGASFGLKPAGKPALTVSITPSTQVFWTSLGTLDGPTVGQRVWAKGKVCSGAFRATWVLVSPPK